MAGFGGAHAILFQVMDFINCNVQLLFGNCSLKHHVFDELHVGCICAYTGDKRDLVPPAPSLTRYKKEVAIKSVSNKKKVADPRLPDERRSSEINLLSTTSLCVRVNTLHVSCSVVLRMVNPLLLNYES